MDSTDRTDGPMLLCYDGSEAAKQAIKRTEALFATRDALG